MNRSTFISFLNFTFHNIFNFLLTVLVMGRQPEDDELFQSNPE